MDTSSPFGNVSLVVLAGGMGSRFGGLKQLFQIGPKRQTILEYTLDDAQAIGIRKVVFVIRKAIEEDFREQVLHKLFRRPFEIKLAFQEISSLPQGHITPSQRQKPWGTGHALWLAFQTMRTPSAVMVNADDYYGPNSLKIAADAAKEGRNAVVVYPLDKTLSTRGPVARGIVTLGKKGEITDIVEHRNLTHENAPTRALASMNCISLTPSMAKPVEDNFVKFCESGRINTLDEECYLPDAIKEALRQGVSVEALCSPDQWMGLTHREDVADVEFKIGRVPLVK